MSKALLAVNNIWADAEGDWFATLTKEQQQKYLELHPHSKYAGGGGESKPAAAPAQPAQQPSAQPSHAPSESTQNLVQHMSKPEDKASFSAESLKPSSPMRQKLGAFMKSRGKAVIDHIKHSGHEWKTAGAAIKALSAGQPLTHEHKHALRAVATDIGIAASVAALGGGLAHGAAALAKHAATHIAQELLLKAGMKAVTGSVVQADDGSGDDQQMDDLLNSIVDQVSEYLEKGNFDPTIVNQAAADVALGKPKSSIGQGQPQQPAAADPSQAQPAQQPTAQQPAAQPQQGGNASAQ